VAFEPAPELFESPPAVLPACELPDPAGPELWPDVPPAVEPGSLPVPPPDSLVSVPSVDVVAGSVPPDDGSDARNELSPDVGRSSEVNWLEVSPDETGGPEESTSPRLVE
jgi:hypothetical protein